MSKKLKIVFRLLFSILFIISVLPTSAYAAEKINTEQPVNLTIRYTDGEKAISDALFCIYRVADTDEYSHMTLTADFEIYENSVSGLSDLNGLSQDQWMILASTLQGYVLRDELSPVAEGTTDRSGMLSFSDLKAGLYLVIGTRVTDEDGYTYSAVPFMVFLPGIDAESSGWDYDVSSSPKYTKDYNPPQDHITRKVLKIWDDAGYESVRPAEVTVQLLKDGMIYDTQTLNVDNNWRYTWDDLEPGYEWEVVETENEGYAVLITRNGITYTVTNRYSVPEIGTNLLVQKRITGDKPKSDSTFSFILSAEDDSCPMPEDCNQSLKEITLTGAGSKDIGEIIFTQPGTYVYTIREKNGGIDGYTYDAEVYTITFEVTEINGELLVTKTIRNNENNTVTAIEFTNNYTTPGKKLPQTGMLWWPVPVLICAGLVFIVIGIMCRRRVN